MPASVARTAATIARRTRAVLAWRISLFNRHPAVEPQMCHSRNICHAIDLDSEIRPRQRRGLNSGPRRPMRAEHARVDDVHPVELLHIYEKHATAQDVLQSRARGLEDRLDVLEALL